MSSTFKVVRICDHVTQKEVVESKEATVVRATGVMYDKVSDDTILSIDKAVYRDVALFPGIHFHKFSRNLIMWIDGSTIFPDPGEEYTVSYSALSIESRQHSQSECEKCGGNGWFVSIADPDLKSIDIISGEDKLVQDFIKVLTTDGRYYPMGSSLKTVNGSVGDTDEISLLITKAVKESEDHVKRMQYESSIAGVEIPPEEALQRVDILEILIEEDGVYIALVLVSARGAEIEMTLKA